MLHCKNCVTSVAKGGLCQHSVAVAETQGTLLEHIQRYRKQKYLESRLAYDNAPKGAGAKKRQKKPHRGQNNFEQLLILSKEDAKEVYDPDLDVPKYCRFTGVYHTDEPFHIIFVQDYKEAKACEQCKVNFARTLLITPWDICIMHEERYLYPLKDPSDRQEYGDTPQREQRKPSGSNA